MIPTKAVNFIGKKIKNISDLRCLAIGIAFKGVPETNDFRNSPAVDFLEALKSKVKSINIWDSVLGTENVKLDFLLDALNNEYTMYAILNNNPKNVDYFNSKIKKHAGLEVVIYDPWRLLNPNYLVISESIKVIHYLSLSHYERIVI